MNASPSIIPTEQHRMPMDQNRINSLLSWWRLPMTINASDMESRVKMFQAFNGDIYKLFQEALRSQAQALKAASERSIGYSQDFFAARQPSEMIKAQSDIVTGFLENLADQTKSWLDLTHKLQDSGSVMVREMAADAAVKEETVVEAAEADEDTRHAVLFDEEPEKDEPLGGESGRALLKANIGKRAASKSRPVSRVGKR